MIVLTKQVTDFFIVDLNKLAPDKHLKLVGESFILPSDHRGIHNVEDVIKHVRHYSLEVTLAQIAHHSMSLATAGLPVGKNGPIVPFE